MTLPRFFKILFTISLFSISYLFSLERIETSQVINNNREYSLSYYENETAISHWYGSDTWAVKFVAEDFATLADSLNVLNPLTIIAVNIYFPTLPAAPVNIRGISYTEDSQNDPLFGDNIAELSVLNHTISETGWHQFPLTTAYSGDGIWVIVDNATNFSNNFMASASGSGKNSFYKVTDGSDVFFNSLYDLNIPQEFLFSIDGYLNIDNDSDRIVLEDVSIEYSHEDLWEYNYKIRNYSDELVTSADLEISIFHPNPEIYDTTYTNITLDLLPQATTNSSEGEAFLIQLPILDSQYKIISSLRGDESGLVLSSKTNKVCNFQDDSETAIVMNFISGNHQVTENLLGIQRAIAQPSWQIFNYGIDASDQLFFSDYAYDYYQDFGVNLMPLTIINGSKYFNSFNVNAIEDNIENNIYYIPKVFDTVEESLVEEENLITYNTSFNYGQRYVFDSFTDNLTIDVFISQKTKHYSPEGDEFIVKEINDLDYNFQRLNEDGNAFYEFTYAVDNVDSLLTSSNGAKFANAIIYREDTNEIISYSRYSLENNILVSNQENEENIVSNIPVLSVYPNPVNSGKTLNIFSSEKGLVDYFTLYNIRGQKVEKYINNNDTIKLPKQLSSGVYFLKASSTKRRNIPLVKLLIIKE